jgi:beta-lactamase class A
MISFKDKRFSLLHALLATFIVILGTFYLTNLWKEKQFTEQLNNTPVSCNYDVKRMGGFKYVKPLMFVDEDCESDLLMNTKQKLISIIDKYKSIGDIESASIYVREYNHNEWMAINESEKYDPGSLFKVPVLITILKMNEINPGFLNKRVPYTAAVNTGKDIAFPSKTITVGQSYTIKELLTYMIKYSDNAATVLLENNMDSKVLQKMFKDMNLEVPNIYASQFKFSVKEYSYFMRAIYNAGYLNVDDSEYAGQLLAQCDFKEGIIKGLPANTRAAHKFGESGNQTQKQLHESAIVYLNSKPYLLTIMTKGKENKKLSQFLGEISQVVYTDMASDGSGNL